MAKLSLSKAWDETRNVLAREGKLIGAVALALVYLPGVIVGVIDPGQTAASIMAGGTATWLMLVTTLIGLVGQLAIIRLALGPATSVGEAIAHGAKRLPTYVGGTLLWMFPLVVVMVIFGKNLLTGAQAESASEALITLIVAFALIYLAVRLILVSAVASAEHVGPVGMLKRAWALSSGNWWRLFVFLMILALAAGVLLAVFGMLSGTVAQLLFGEIEPMTVSALVVALVTEIASALVTVLFITMIARLYAQVSGVSTVSVPSSGH